MTETRARRTDPATSHEAAAAQEPKLRASQARVLNMFRLYGDMHDKQLLAYLNDAEKQAGLKLMSPSGARSRRSELAQPNEDRLDELRVEWMDARGYTEYHVGDKPFRPAPNGPPGAGAFATDAEVAEAEVWARQRLRDEGFRSPLWDTGRREKVDGYNVIVWGIAR